jgi:hypothetical protein
MSKGMDDREELPTPGGFSLPESGIEEIDRAIFDLFDNVLPLQVKIKDQSTKVPVVFSTGERFALTRRNSPIRDRNNATILPIIAIYREKIDISPGQSGYGTAISPRDQETYVVKKRLSKKDREYQNIINRFGIKSQENVASRKNFQEHDFFPGNIAKAGTVASRRNGKNLSLISNAHNTDLSNNITDNIIEIITAPYPTFMTLSYQIIFWTQYVQHMNQLLEVLMTRFTGQDLGYQITTDSGFEYVAFVKSPLNSDDNFNDFSKDERIIRYTVQIDVPGYLFASRKEGLSTPFRKYESAPQIEFGYTQVAAQMYTKSKNPEDVVDQNQFILSEIESESMTKLRRGQTSANLIETIKNPFTDETTFKSSKIRLRNERAGETVASSRISVDLQTTLDSPTSE